MLHSSSWLHNVPIYYQIGPKIVCIYVCITIPAANGKKWQWVGDELYHWCKQYNNLFPNQPLYSLIAIITCERDSCDKHCKKLQTILAQVWFKTFRLSNRWNKNDAVAKCDFSANIFIFKARYKYIRQMPRQVYHTRFWEIIGKITHWQY